MATLDLCGFADITASNTCGETSAGIASDIFVGFKEDLTALPGFKEPSESDDDMGVFAEIEDTPGFKMKPGKRFFRFVIDTDSGQITSTSIAQGKGFTAQLVFKIVEMTPTISALMRVLNNRKDAFVAVKDDKHGFKMLYHPNRNIKIDNGGISYDSGTTPDSDSGTTVTLSCPAIAPVTYYKGTFSTVEGSA